MKMQDSVAISQDGMRIGHVNEGKLVITKMTFTTAAEIAAVAAASLACLVTEVLADVPWDEKLCTREEFNRTFDLLAYMSDEECESS